MKLLDSIIVFACFALSSSSVVAANERNGLPTSSGGSHSINQPYAGYWANAVSFDEYSVENPSGMINNPGSPLRVDEGQIKVYPFVDNQPRWFTWPFLIVYTLLLVIGTVFVFQYLNNRNVKLSSIKIKDDAGGVTLETDNMEVVKEEERHDETLARAMEPTVPELSKEDRDFLNHFNAFIDANIAEPNLNMALIQDKMHMGYSTFYRRIKTLTGLSGNEYIRKKRLNRAKELLDQGVAAQEASVKCGFLDHVYFRKCFKKEFGVTPKGYVSGEKGEQN